MRFPKIKDNYDVFNDDGYLLLSFDLMHEARKFCMDISRKNPFSMYQLYSNFHEFSEYFLKGNLYEI